MTEYVFVYILLCLCVYICVCVCAHVRARVHAFAFVCVKYMCMHVYGKDMRAHFNTCVNIQVYFTPI